MTNITVIDRPGRRANNPVGKPKRPPRVTPELVVACKAIVWEGQELDQAASSAGLTTRALRLALQRPHVLAFLKEEREVLLAVARAQNIHHAIEVRRGDNAMARLGAIKVIEAQTDHQPGQGVAREPGLVIQIVTGGAERAHMRTVEAKSLIDQESGGHDG